jgi:hypothetical protein
MNFQQFHKVEAVLAVFTESEDGTIGNVCRENAFKVLFLKTVSAWFSSTECP